MNAVMPGHSPQFHAPYGVGLEGVVDTHPANAHYPTNEGNDSTNNNSNSNAHNNRNTRTSNGSIETPHGLPPEDPPGGEQPLQPTSPSRQQSRQPSVSPPQYVQTTSSTQPVVPPPPVTPAPPHPSQPLTSPMSCPPLGVASSGLSPAGRGYGNGGGIGPAPFGLGNPAPPLPDPLLHNPVAASFPWSIGSTDGSFALVNLQQQQQQIQLRQQQEELQRRQAAMAAASANNPSSNGVTVNANATVGVDEEGTDATGGAGAVPADADPASTPNPATAQAQAAIAQAASIIQNGRSLYHDKLFHQSSSAVEGVLAASCDVMGFDIAEMWLRTGLKTHQLTNSHLRPTALQDSVRQDLVDVYYGERSNERTHRLSPALCKRAKDANDVVWVTAQTQNGAEALRMSISNVRTAVAVPVCHEASNTNVTIIYFSIRRIVLRPAAVEFLIHMSLSAAVTSVNALATDGLIDRPPSSQGAQRRNTRSLSSSAAAANGGDRLFGSPGGLVEGLSRTTQDRVTMKPPTASISYRRVDKTSITGARLDLQWRQLLNVEYLTDGGNSWIHTAVFDGKPVVVKTLRPECQDTAVAINEIESEVAVHSRVSHPNIVSLVGAGWTSKKVRFIVLERLDGGTLTQMLGYDTRIRDRRRRFWRKKQLPYLDVLRCARSLACAMQYCHEQAIPGSMVMHRDLKPDNIGFTLDGQVKLLDFGLARIMEGADPQSNDTYEMSGETGSLRYMAPEVAENLPYNHKADVYSFGMIFWEMNAGKRPFSGMNRDSFYEQVVHGGVRPHLSKKWPSELNKLIAECWNVQVEQRPTFAQIVDRIDDLLTNEKGGKPQSAAKNLKKRVTGIIDRHSTWF